MPRRPRQMQLAEGAAYHVFSRGHNREALFADPADLAYFPGLLGRYRVRFELRLYRYCVMTNHVRLLMQLAHPRRLSGVMAGLLLAYVRYFNRRHGFVGHLWQGRFKSFPVEADDHLYAVLRYVERNALRANRVARAEAWRWGSLWRRERGDAKARALVHPWPVTTPGNWVELMNAPQTEAELEALRQWVSRNSPFGSADWCERTAQQLGLQGTLRPRERPPRRADHDAPTLF